MKTQSRLALAAVFVSISLTSISAFAAGTRQVDPYTDGARLEKTDPYTDGARLGKVDPYTDGTLAAAKGSRACAM